MRITRRAFFDHVEEGDEAKPKLMLHDSDAFDVEDWLTNTLSGTEFPVIICINSCRVDTDVLESRTSHERTD